MLRQSKTWQPIADVVAEAMNDGTPILGVCLGLQLLFTRSSEGGSIKGLDFISGEVVKLPESVKTPQMGWNTIDFAKSHPLLDGVKDHSYVYFVHSYYPQPTDPDVSCGNYRVWGQFCFDGCEKESVCDTVSP